MPRAAELKTGMVVSIDGNPMIVRQIQTQSPSARGATTLYKIRFSNVQSGQKLDQSLKGDDQLADADFQRRTVQFLYKDADGCTFMDQEDFSQHLLNDDQVAELLPFLPEEPLDLTALIVDGVCVAVQPPDIVALQITETPPAMKGSSQSARTKTAVLSTGLEIQIPEYLETGETVKVNTGTREFVSRA